MAALAALLSTVMLGKAALAGNDGGRINTISDMMTKAGSQDRPLIKVLLIPLALLIAYSAGATAATGVDTRYSVAALGMAFFYLSCLHYDIGNNTKCRHELFSVPMAVLMFVIALLTLMPPPCTGEVEEVEACKDGQRQRKPAAWVVVIASVLFLTGEIQDKLDKDFPLGLSGELRLLFEGAAAIAVGVLAAQYSIAQQ